jgi:class 3 adenylate cyclase/tetratricopeptide (TPR) repeat protein
VPPVAERRLVSVLFADLVGFTAASAGRDAEDTRELLTRYFETSRRLIGLYGGTIEKFIGDAVMAVWGTPTATEDDAERAVRAGLDLVAAVTALGDELGVPDLRARAGVLTGEAAVTIGAEGQGMVAGDLVNTASRVQSAAEPGAVLVGEATRRASERTIVYDDAGEHAMKGKDGPTRLWRARRVVSGLRGALKSHGLEAPFVGRDRELRQIKDLFHASAEQARAHLVSVTGIAGIGKSRLSWEFYKYFDGIADTVYWHRGRCLSYGEGVAYWALADMVRMRCRIAEDDAPEAALEKLRATLAEHVDDASERVHLEPRIAHLLGLAVHEARDRADLFAAWRLFFERLADRHPTVLAFEDVQWADASLLDFIEYLLEWSRTSPILVVTLGRPELLERRPGWGAAQRSFTSLYLEPLGARAMEALLEGLVPGVPAEARDRILLRAEGIPLYAVETVRMLLDRGLLVDDGDAYRLTGSIDALDVPETLHALIAARLDGLLPDERRLIQDAAVLGKTFTREALVALGTPPEGMDALLASLVRKEVLGVQSDLRSPGHGQHGFLQDLVRHVAYETLARRDRRFRHLAAAAHLRAAYAEDLDEVVEVVAAHYLAANDAVPDAADGEDVRGEALAMLVRAGVRAESLAAATEARRYFEQASALADDSAVRAALLDRAGTMASRAGDADGARTLLRSAIELHEAAGDTHAAARVLGRLGRFEAFTGRRDEAVAGMERAFQVIRRDEPDEDLALLAARLGLAYWYSGETDRATEYAEFALDIAEAYAFPRALALALRLRAGIAHSRRHPAEAGALLASARRIALEHDLVDELDAIHIWFSDRCFNGDDYREALGHLDEALALTRRIGDRPREWGVLAERSYALYMLGDWDESLAASADLTPELVRSGGQLLSMLQTSVAINLDRGGVADARRTLALFARLADSTDLQERAVYLAARASLHRAEGRLEEALADGEATIDAASTMNLSAQSAKQGIVEALEAAHALGHRTKVEELMGLIDAVPPGIRPPYLSAQAARFRSRVSGDPAGYEEAAAVLRDREIPFWLAVVLLERAELTGDDAGLDEARTIFLALGATPWVDRAATPQEVRPAHPARSTPARTP